MKQNQSGRRLQIITLQIFRNKNDAITECSKLMHYMKTKENENYLILGHQYGKPKDALVKQCQFMLTTDLIENPRKTLYEISKVFMDTKKVDSLDVGDMGLMYDLQKIYDFLRGKKNDVTRDATS